MPFFSSHQTLVKSTLSEKESKSNIKGILKSPKGSLAKITKGPFTTWWLQECVILHPAPSKASKQPLHSKQNRDLRPPLVCYMRFYYSMEIKTNPGRCSLGLLLLNDEKKRKRKKPFNFNYAETRGYDCWDGWVREVGPGLSNHFCLNSVSASKTGLTTFSLVRL